MATVATLSRTWIKRQITIGSIVLAVGLYFFYDGKFTYPEKNIRFHAYQRFVQEGKEDDWPAFAKQNGWNERPQEKELSIREQYTFGTIAVLGSLAAFALLAFSWNRRLTSDGTTVTTTSGAQIPIAAFTATDRKKWDRKGIAYANYELFGKKGQITIDDYKYERAEIILLEIEENIAAHPLTDTASE